MGLSQHRFLVHKQKGGSAYQRKPLGLDSITVAQGDFSCSPGCVWAFPQACENPWPQCRQACRQLAPWSQDVQGRMLLRSSLGPRRGVYERSGGNGERGPRPGAVSAVLSRWGLVLTFSSPSPLLKLPRSQNGNNPFPGSFQKPLVFDGLSEILTWCSACCEELTTHGEGKVALMGSFLPARGDWSSHKDSFPLLSLFHTRW